MRERVADLRALIQPERAEHAVGDAGPGERGLRRFGRVPVAGEHEHLVGRDAGRERVGDDAGDPLGLLALAGERVRVGAPAGAAHGDQRLGHPVAVVSHARDGRVQDLGAAAEVACEHDPLMTGEALGERERVLGPRAAEAVDQLIVIPDDRDVPVGAGEQLDQGGLGAVGVLKLIHQHPGEAVAVVGEQVGLLGQQPHREREHVIEVHRV